jgi:hypothetical protein
MIDRQAALLALRGRLLTLSQCTTGAQSLSATPTGYARAAGSFVADGIVVGAEILASGFTTSANNGQGVITAVTASTLTVDAYTVTAVPGGYTVTARVLATEAAAAGRTVSVGLFAMRQWVNTAITPVAARPWVQEQFLPGPAQQVTLSRAGQIEVLPQYVITLYGLSGTGAGALYKLADAILSLFSPTTSLTLSTGDVLTVSTVPAPYPGQLIAADPGWSALPTTIPCTARSANTS